MSPFNTCASEFVVTILHNVNLYYITTYSNRAWSVSSLRGRCVSVVLHFSFLVSFIRLCRSIGGIILV
jgi:hypothetical protein